MTSKVELRSLLNENGYELGPFASKDTLSVVICLHTIVEREKNINVAQLSDVELRKSLIEHGRIVGPVTNHTRAIYQRKLLEVLTNTISEGQDDVESEIDEPIVQTQYDNKTKPLPSTKINSYSSRKNDEPMIIRHDYKATSSSRDLPIRNTYGTSNLYDDSNEIRPRKEQQPFKTNKDYTSKKVVFDDEFEKKKVNHNDKLQVATKSSNTFLYGITIGVALIVFVLYLWFGK